MKSTTVSTLRNVIAGIITSVVFGIAMMPGVATAEPRRDIVASFEGNSIRLADDWGDARACTSDGVSTRCYRSEVEMDAAESALKRSFASACTPSVRVYRSTGWGGGVLEITARFVVVSLAPYGFDNDASSYRIGACSARMFDTTTGGGPYPGNTAAGAQASSMVSGWDNRVSSVYIN